MPKSVDGDAAMVAFVAHNAGSIGYADKATPHEGVKVLEVHRRSTDIWAVEDGQRGDGRKMAQSALPTGQSTVGRLEHEKPWNRYEVAVQYKRPRVRSPPVPGACSVDRGHDSAALADRL